MWFDSFGYFLTTLAGYIQQNIFSEKSNAWQHNVLSSFMAVIGLSVAWTNTPTDYVPRPAFTKETLYRLFGDKRAIQFEFNGELQHGGIMATPQHF